MRLRGGSLLAVAALAAAGAHGARAEEPVAGATRVHGSLFLDLSHLDQTTNGIRSDSHGNGADLKRFYIDVQHGFSEVWSARVLTDINWLRGQDPTDLWFKYAYLQGRFGKAFTLRVGSAPMPWIPLVNKWYGFRYIDPALLARAKVAGSADWGLHALGALGSDGRVQYQVSVATGAGFKQPRLGNGPDVEARLSWQPGRHGILAIGGYSGTLGQDVGGRTALHTARRWSAMAAYAGDRWRVGAQYFRARDYTQVVLPRGDRSRGWSAWASVQLTRRIALFARHDDFAPATVLHPRRRNRYGNAGIEWRAREWLRLAAVWKRERLTDGGSALKSGNEAGVWAQVTF